MAAPLTLRSPLAPSDDSRERHAEAAALDGPDSDGDQASEHHAHAEKICHTVPSHRRWALMGGANGRT